MAAYFENVTVQHIVYKKDEKRLYVIIMSSHLLYFDILHAMEAIVPDAVANAEVKPTVTLVREVKIALIVVLSAL